MEPSALPSYVTAGFTSLQNQISALADVAWPIIMVSIGIFVTIKLVKRFAGKL